MNDKDKQTITFKYLINKMLKKYNTNVDYVSEHPMVIDKDFLGGSEIPWQHYYTWTLEEESKFRQEGIDYFRLVFKWTKRYSTMVMDNFLVRYGLTITNDVDTATN
jgi:hypothetical protein